MKLDFLLNLMIDKMNDKRKKDVLKMAEAVEDANSTGDSKKAIVPSTVNPSIEKKLLKADEIIATKKLEIPKCHVKPINGRMFLIEISGYDLKSPGGLILPQKMMPKKNDDMEDIKRYFLVDWDTGEIPQAIQDKLCVGLEVNPFMNEAESFRFPRVIDWQGNNIFIVMHYTELAGISKIKPEIVE